MARPLKQIDARQVESLAGIGCTNVEIAAVLGVSEDTIVRRFAECVKKGRESAKASLRRAQWRRAQAGSDTMLVWLGKQMLGQKDKIETEHSGTIVNEHRDADEESVIAAADAIRCRREKLPAL